MLALPFGRVNVERLPDQLCFALSHYAHVFSHYSFALIQEERTPLTHLPTQGTFLGGTPRPPGNPDTSGLANPLELLGKSRTQDTTLERRGRDAC